MRKPLFSSEAVLAGILVLLALATTLMLVRLYQTSRLLGESDRKAFVLESQNKRVILGDYFRRRLGEVDTFRNLRVFQTYYEAKAVGLSSGNALDVLSSHIEQELLVRRLNTEEQGRTVYASATFFDMESGKIVARTDFSPKGKWIDENLFASLSKRPWRDVEIESLCESGECRVLVVGVVKHGNQAKGLLLMELASEPIVGEVQVVRLQRIDDFAGLISQQGTLFIGPEPLIGKNVRELFGVPLESLADRVGGTVQATFPGQSPKEVVIASGVIRHTGLHLIQVTAESKFAGEQSPFLWAMAMVSLMGGLVVMLVHISRTHAERNVMLQELSEAHDHLEARVRERTSELKLLNEALLSEIQERRKVEEALRRAGEELELRVVERTSELLRTNMKLQEQIDRRSKVEEALRQSEERFRALTETTSEWIWEVDERMRYSYASPRLLELLGYLPEEVLDKTPFDLMPPEEVPRMRTQLAAIFASQRPFKALEHFNLHKDGRVILLETSGLPFFDASGMLRGYRGIGRDITDRKKSEELLIRSEKLKAVADLSAGVAHNFNNLLQIVLANAEISLKATEKRDVAGVRSRIENILECCRFGAETVKRLGDFARSESRVNQVQGRVFSLAGTVQRAVEMTETWWKTAPEREGINIALQTRLSDDCFVRGEENELFEVVVNLIKNSAEALPIGGRIAVNVWQENEDSLLTVHDNGIGISEKIRSRLFQPFFSTKGPKGTGMGLASSYGIVVRHGGTISVDSEEGRGTTFTVRLPAAQAPQKPSVLDSAAAVGPLRVLVVDDQALIAASMEMLFVQNGHTVFSALSGHEGIEVFQREPLDVVISDLSMPSMTGWQFAREIKDASEAKGMPRPVFIILTGWGTNLPEEDRLEELGVDAVVRKPVRARRLMASVNQLVKERRDTQDHSAVPKETTQAYDS